MTRIPRSFLLAAVLTALVAAPAQAATLIFTSNNDGTIRKLDNGTFSTFATTTPGTSFGATGVAVDTLNESVFWTGQTTGDTSYVNRAPLGGGSTTTLWTYPATSHGTSITVDSMTRYVYWGFSEATGSSINQGTGSGAAGSMAATQTRSVTEPIVALDAPSALLYWAVSQSGVSANFKVGSSNALASGPLTFANSGTDKITSIALSPSADTVYWASCIQQANIVGSGCSGEVRSKSTTTAAGAYSAVTGATGITGLSAIAVDSSGCIYYATNTGQITRHATNSSCAPATLGTDTGKITLSLWLVEPPTAIVQPSVTGDATANSTLTCSDAGWAIDNAASRLARLPTEGRSYQWSRDGTAIAGATATTYVATAAGSYTCTQSASNAAGTSSTTSNPFIVTAAAATAATDAATATTTKTYPKITIAWKLKARTLTGTFKPVKTAKTYTIAATGATRKSASCTATKKKVTCTLTLKKGKSTITVTAKSKTKAIVARTTVSKKAT